ncbi:MAG: radical SAM protein, partial [Thermodesulfobacteriota bacterium]|nr:radical SAM protein [Thermodesulfobacteriota bacterium]
MIVPLGLLYLAGYLHSKMPEIEISIIDAALEDLDARKIVEKVKTFKPEIVGLTGLTAHTHAIKETATYIRRVFPQTMILAGGPASTSNYIELLKESSIDFGIIGEGEETLYQIIKALKEGKELSLLDGLVYQNHKGEITVNNACKLIEDLDRIPRPAYHLISVEDYFNSPKRNAQSPIYISKQNLPVMTSRGCPFNCIYCHNTFGKKFRTRSSANVVDEIVWLKSTFNIDELEIIDDIFNFDKERAKDIFRKLNDSNLNLKISFPNGLKYEMIDDELLELFKKAGVYRLAFGIESGNPRIQKIIRKSVNLPRMREVIDKAVNMGFFVSGFFQLGLPGETKEEMLDTIRFAASTKLHTAMFHLTIPFPGTPMYEEHIKGKIKSNNFKDVRNISINLSAVSDR